MLRPRIFHWVINSQPIAYGFLTLWFGFWVWATLQTLEFYFG